MEVEIRQSCGLTGPIKPVPHIVPSVPGGIVEYPRSSSECEDMPR